MVKLRHPISHARKLKRIRELQKKSKENINHPTNKEWENAYEENEHGFFSLTK